MIIIQNNIFLPHEGVFVHLRIIPLNNRTGAYCRKPNSLRHDNIQPFQLHGLQGNTSSAHYQGGRNTRKKRVEIYLIRRTLLNRIITNALMDIVARVLDMEPK